MKNLSLKLDDSIFEETEVISVKLKVNRNRYINNALSFYNKLHKQKELAQKLAKESKLLRKDSMKVLAEFEKLDDENSAI
jgi:dsDNA-specific endonuclease/ATPase MutS2